jgi:hypothetical protein
MTAFEAEPIKTGEEVPDAGGGSRETNGDMARHTAADDHHNWRQGIRLVELDRHLGSHFNHTPCGDLKELAGIRGRGCQADEELILPEGHSGVSGWSN